MPTGRRGRGFEGSSQAPAGTVEISALTALPAFFVAGVPVLLRVMAGRSILLAIVIAVLLLTPARRSRVAQPA